MKKLYFVFLFFISSLAFAQDGANGDIEGFSLYPNPVTEGRVFITTLQNAPKTILVFDVFGTQVLQTTILGKELDLSDLGTGVYVLRVVEKDKTATRKLIVK